jgi:NADH pyrophosphatase NudC (nudix superfamily)
MNIGSIFLVLAVLIPVALYVAQPYLETRSRRMTAEAHDLSALLAERDRVVNALQELDFDQSLNKIPVEDYPVQRAALLQKGAEVLKKLDAMTAEETASPAEDRVEKAVAARRRAKPASDDDDVEALIAARRSGRKEKSGGFCPRCGKPVTASDRFCPSCGKSLS